MKMSLPKQILLALLAGIAVGLVCALTGTEAFTAAYLKPFGDIFVNLLKFIVVPVVLFSMIDGILSTIPDTRLNGHRIQRLPNNVNISFRYVEGEALLLRLDLAGIAGSSGSACTSGSLDPSHVLLAIGLPHEIAHGSLRLSLGTETTDEEVDYVLEKLPEIVSILRAMSPLNAETSTLGGSCPFMHDHH